MPQICHLRIFLITGIALILLSTGAFAASVKTPCRTNTELWVRIEPASQATSWTSCVRGKGSKVNVSPQIGRLTSNCLSSGQAAVNRVSAKEVCPLVRSEPM